MAASTYDNALARMFVHEGGYTNDPSDPGGPTNFGITIADYRKYEKANATAADVKTMRLDDAKTIYRKEYWNAMRCDDLPAGLDYAVFDYGVNSGVSRAIKVLQRQLGMADDGRVTEATLAAVRKRDTAALIAKLCDERLAFLKQLKTWPAFGVGWGRRVAEVRAAALAMANALPTIDAKSTPVRGKAVVPPNKPAQRTTAGVVAVAGAAAAQQAHQSGAQPAVIAAIVVVAIALAVAVWLAWRWRHRQQQDAPITTGDHP